MHRLLVFVLKKRVKQPCLQSVRKRCVLANLRSHVTSNGYAVTCSCAAWHTVVWLDVARRVVCCGSDGDHKAEKVGGTQGTSEIGRETKNTLTDLGERSGQRTNSKQVQKIQTGGAKSTSHEWEGGVWRRDEEGVVCECDCVWVEGGREWERVRGREGKREEEVEEVVVLTLTAHVQRNTPTLGDARHVRRNSWASPPPRPTLMAWLHLPCSCVYGFKNYPHRLLDQVICRALVLQAVSSKNPVARPRQRLHSAARNRACTLRYSCLVHRFFSTKANPEPMISTLQVIDHVSVQRRQTHCP